MRLTQWTDYSLRVLMYCAACADRPRPVTITEIAQGHGISRSHLTKIVMTLASLGYLATTRGRGGGLRLLRPAREITVGEVIRRTETDFTLVECFDPGSNACLLNGRCRLKGALKRAMARYLEALDSVTLEELVAPKAPNVDGTEIIASPGLPGPAGPWARELLKV